MHYRRFQPYYPHDHDLMICFDDSSRIDWRRRLTMEVCMFLILILLCAILNAMNDTQPVHTVWGM